MDSSNLKNILLSNLKSFFSKASLLSKMKEAFRLPYAKIYIFILPLLFTAIFVITTYPYDMLIRKVLKSFEKNVFKSINVREIDFSLFDITIIKEINIILNSRNEINIKIADIDLSLNPVTLLLGKDIKGSIQLTGFKYSSPDTQIDLNLNGNIHLDFNSFSEFPASGNIKFIIQNAILKLGEITLPENMPVMGGESITIQPIRIKSIILDLNLSGKKIKIQNARISGTDLRGNISGSIAVSKFFWNSRLNLKISIDTDSEILKDYKEILKIYIGDNNMLVIPLHGTISSPRPAFKQIDSSTSTPPTNHKIKESTPPISHKDKE